MNRFRVFSPFGIYLVLSLTLVLFSSCIFSGDVAEPSDTMIHVEEDHDISLILFRHPESREAIVDFYAGVSGSREIAELILRNADKFEVSASLAFSLAFAESSFNTRAVNRNASSVDRGLFQLNSRSFPDMTEAQFFDPGLNTETGVGYLRYCLDVGKNTVTALAMYNAGRTRVTERGAPRITLDYISRILDFQRALEDEIETSLVTKRSLTAKGDSKRTKQVSYVLDKNKSLK